MATYDIVRILDSKHEGVYGIRRTRFFGWSVCYYRLHYPNDTIFPRFRWRRLRYYDPLFFTGYLSVAQERLGRLSPKAQPLTVEVVHPLQTLLGDDK